jgi:hypothetical protein
MRSARSDIISFLLAVPTVLRQGKRGQLSGVPMSPADCEDDKNDTESAVCQIDHHRFAAFLNFSCPSSAGLKINLFTLNENPLCHESSRRARKNFKRPRLPVAAVYDRRPRKNSADLEAAAPCTREASSS